MERLRESSDLSDFSNAIDLCRRVIANDAVATIGLPANASQRALVIERELSDLLSGETERRLKRSESESEVAEVADWLIGLNRELGMEDWLVGAGVGVFRDAGRLPILLRRLVELDVDASAFCYTADFGSLLLEHADCDIRHFVLKLPRDVVPLASLLEYGLSRGDDFLLSDLLDRGGDLSGALSVLGNAGCTSEVSLIILSHAESPSESEDNAMETAIVWLFTRSGGVFPRATQILESSVATSSLVFERVQSFIERTGRPFGLERFVDAMSIVLSNRCSDDALARRLDSLILNRRLKVSSGCAGRLMRRIFSPASGDDDDREALLIHLLSCDLPDKFSESLLGLCESFGFRSAKRQIQLGLEKYESVIREAAIDVDFDIFSFIGDLLKRSDGSRGSIQAAVLRNATILCARDGVGFSRFAREHLKESLSEVVTSVNDVRLRHSIAHELLRSGSLPTLNSETEASFFGFLCEFFPSEARSFAELREGDLRDLLEPATQFGVWDCCAVIHSRLGDVNRVCESFRSFIEECLVCYVEGGMSKCDGVVSFGVEFARTFLRSHNGNDAIRFAESSVRAFAIPLFALSERGSDSERTGTVVAFLCQIVTLALNVIPFSDFLRLFVVEFQELPFGFARYCLLSVLNDYEYDLDQNLSMVLLYHADEQNSHAKYIRGKIGGTVTGGLECDRCHCALFGVSCAIQLFECGHIFHRTNECLPKTVCPVCNPEERLGQDVGVAIQSIPRSRFRRELTRFENILSRKSGVSVATEPRVSDIRIPQRHIFPL
jgi:hypothetical protein